MGVEGGGVVFGGGGGFIDCGIMESSGNWRPGTQDLLLLEQGGGGWDGFEVIGMVL